MSGINCVLAGISGGDIQVVTAGFVALKTGDLYGYSSGDTGSISDGTFNLLGGATITAMYWFTDNGSTNILVFGLSGTYSNAGWNSLTVGGNTYTRASAAYSTSSGTTWTWTTTTNPFPSAGTPYTVTFI